MPDAEAAVHSGLPERDRAVLPLRAFPARKRMR